MNLAALASAPSRTMRFTGRDRDEPHRAATTLELLYDLTIVVGFAAISGQTAELVAEGHVIPALVGFGFMLFAVVWTWINYSWFMSAYDTDDWYVRLATFVQMLGVLVLALGTPDVFRSLAAGEHIDNRIAVIGYVIMLLGMLALWVRAAIQDRERHRTAIAYASALAIAQVGWVALTILWLPPLPTFLAMFALYLVELGGPLLAELRFEGTPWHPHHIAERYGCLTIIALGEIIVGTTASLGSLIETVGWTWETILIGLLGVGLAGSCWWVAFAVPWGEFLALKRRAALGYGYLHPLLFGSIAGIGAGLHVAALSIEGHVAIPPMAVLAGVALPLVAFMVSLFLLYGVFIWKMDLLHVAMVSATALFAAAAFGVLAAGGSIALSLLVLLIGPWTAVIGYEALGHRAIAHGRATLRAERDARIARGLPV